MTNPRITGDMLLAVVGASIAAGSTIDSNSTILDMAGAEGVLFIATITDSVATGVATLKVESNSISSDTGMVGLAGASASATCAVNDDINDKVLTVEVYQPAKRYVQAVRTSATANIAFGPLLALRYGKKKLPIPIDATVLAAAAVTSPADL